MALVSAVFLTFALACSTITALPLPKGFVLDVKADCGKTVKDNKPSITVVSDLNLYVKAYCANGEREVSTTDNAKYSISGSFSSPSKDCIFTNADKKGYSYAEEGKIRGNFPVASLWTRFSAIKFDGSTSKRSAMFYINIHSLSGKPVGVTHQRKNSNVYTVDISVAYGLIGSTIQKRPQFYSLTCTFDANGLQKTAPVTISRGYITPWELRVDAGKKTSSLITLNLFNVRNKVITTPIVRGCKVYLSAVTDGKNKEVGLRPTACDAFNVKTKKRIPILRAGCGTGLVLSKDAGFTTLGTTTRSPYFDMVQVEEEKDMNFDCVFTLCVKNCDGNSCKVGSRRKRSVYMDEEVASESNTVEVEKLLK